MTRPAPQAALPDALAFRAAGRSAGLARPWAAVAADYWSLTKPRITVFNLVTAFTALWLATGGRPEARLVAVALAGTALSVASGCVLNNWLERDRDRLMACTRGRALPAGRVAPGSALAFGCGLGVAGVGLLAAAANPKSAFVAAFGIAYYAGVYTALKARTAWNTVAGGVAGSVPPLIAWAAATGGLAGPGWIVAALVFLWQPVHFWALSLSHVEDYRRAGVRMLPVTHGEPATRRSIVTWAVLLVAATLAAYGLGLAGPVYLGGAALLGAGLLGLAWTNLAAPGPAAARRLFHASNAYLALLFLLLVLDCRC